MILLDCRRLYFLNNIIAINKNGKGDKMNFNQGLGIGLVVGFLLSGAILFPYILKLKRESKDTEIYYQIALKYYLNKIQQMGGEI